METYFWDVAVNDCEDEGAGAVCFGQIVTTVPCPPGGNSVRGYMNYKCEQ
jgi:hypothetical protein